MQYHYPSYSQYRGLGARFVETQMKWEYLYVELCSHSHTFSRKIVFSLAWGNRQHRGWTKLSSRFNGFVVIGANARERAYFFLKGFELSTETLDTLQTSDRYLVDQEGKFVHVSAVHIIWILTQIISCTSCAYLSVTFPAWLAFDSVSLAVPPPADANSFIFA